MLHLRKIKYLNTVNLRHIPNLTLLQVIVV